MDFQYRLNRKCFSLLVSLILHALLLLLFFTIAFKIIFVGTPETINELSNNATVTFQNPSTNQLLHQHFLNNQQSQQTQETSEDEQNIDQNDQFQEIESIKTQVETVQSNTEQENPVRTNTQNTAIKESSLEEAHTEDSKQEEALNSQKNQYISAVQSSDITGVPKITEIKEISNHSQQNISKDETNQKLIKRNARRRRIAMLAKNFVSDFRNSYRSENQILGSSKATGVRTNKSYIEERVEEFKLADFMKKVHRALAQAIHKTPPISIYSAKNYDKNIVIQIEHLKDGKIKILTFESTEIPEVDYQIKSLLNNVSFPPIPDRFNKNSIIYTKVFGVFIKEGTNDCRFYAHDIG